MDFRQIEHAAYIVNLLNDCSKKTWKGIIKSAIKVEKRCWSIINEVQMRELQIWTEHQQHSLRKWIQCILTALYCEFRILELYLVFMRAWNYYFFRGGGGKETTFYLCTRVDNFNKHFLFCILKDSSWLATGCVIFALHGIFRILKGGGGIKFYSTFRKDL